MIAGTVAIARTIAIFEACRAASHDLQQYIHSRNPTQHKGDIFQNTNTSTVFHTMASHLQV